MTAYKKIMICLDLTETDDLLIQYAKYIATHFKQVQQLLFVHNIRFDNEEDADLLFSDLEKPLETIIQENIEEKIEAIFDKNTAIQKHVLVTRDHTTPLILSKLAHENNIDMVILGKKISYRGSGLAVEKLLRISKKNTHIFLVPETAYHQIKKVLVPIDFSKNSLSSIEAGLNIAAASEANTTCLHVLSIPRFYFPYIASDSIIEELEETTQKRWNKFEKQLPTPYTQDLRFTHTLNHRKNTAQSIYDFAIKMQADLIVLSMKGKSEIAAFAIGSTTLKLVQYDLHIPLLITK